MPVHSTAFIIEPYLKPSTIRSPLGFMSQATYWAQLLFPGVTVLTRDFLHVQLLLRELRRRKKAGDSRQRIEDILRSPRLHRRLEQEYKRAVGAENDEVVTKMTYWQRYASLFEYFGLWNAPSNLQRRDLWRIVFSRRVPPEFRTWVTAEPSDKRRRRIGHTEWYLSFQGYLGEAAGKVPTRLLWWVAGEGGPREVSEEIRLSRRLSYAFLIWQTLFEVGSTLRFRGVGLPKTSSRPVELREAVDLLVLATEAEASNDTLRRIYSGLLSAHVHQLKDAMPKWQATVERRPWYESSLTRLYDGSQVRELAAVTAGGLFSRLVGLHQHYCQSQGKTEAEFIRPSGAGFTALKFPKISASFQATPWGLFGYRLNQAVLLHRSGAA